MITIRHQAIKAEKDNELLSERVRNVSTCTSDFDVILMYGMM